MNTTMHIDTHKAFVHLTTSGFSDEQANAILDTISSTDEGKVSNSEFERGFDKVWLEFDRVRLDIKDVKRELMYRAVPMIIASISIVQAFIAYIK